jgi:hypothetical protein
MLVGGGELLMQNGEALAGQTDARPLAWAVEKLSSINIGNRATNRRQSYSEGHRRPTGSQNAHSMSRELKPGGLESDLSPSSWLQRFH